MSEFISEVNDSAGDSLVNGTASADNGDFFTDDEIREIMATGRKRGVASDKMADFLASGKVIEKLDWESIFDGAKDRKQSYQAFVNVKHGKLSDKYGKIVVKNVQGGSKDGLYLVNTELLAK